MSSQAYDWNKKATYYTIVRKSGTEENKKATYFTAVRESGTEENEIVFEFDSCISFDFKLESCTLFMSDLDEEIQHKFATELSLTHGDVVDLGDDSRQSYASIAMYDEATAKYSFVKNPDDLGSGSLTIPAEVLVNVDDASVKYENIYTLVEIGGIHMHLSHKDKFLRDIIEVDIPDEYTFELEYQLGEVEAIYVSKKGCERYREFDIDSFRKTSWNDIVEFCVGASQEQAKFTIQVILNGDELEKYKTKYGSVAGIFWGLPNSDFLKNWSVEMGANGVGSDHRHWKWHFTGPATEEHKAKEWVESHLLGFTYEFCSTNQI